VRILREAATGWLQGLLVGLDDAALADLARGLAHIISQLPHGDGPCG